MIVVEVLTYECVWLDSPINVHLRHVEVINEVDKPLGSRRGKFTASFLLQGFLQDTWSGSFRVMGKITCIVTVC